MEQQNVVYWISMEIIIKIDLGARASRKLVLMEFLALLVEVWQQDYYLFIRICILVFYLTLIDWFTFEAAPYALEPWYDKSSKITSINNVWSKEIITGEKETLVDNGTYKTHTLILNYLHNL